MPGIVVALLSYTTLRDTTSVRAPIDYRYTVVNDRRVLVDPRTHRVIQIVE